MTTPKCPLKPFVPEDFGGPSVMYRFTAAEIANAIMATRFEEWKAGLTEVCGTVGPKGSLPYSSWTSLNHWSYGDTHLTRILPPEKIKGKKTRSLRPGWVGHVTPAKR